jgi:hypothetical protein
VEVIAVLMAGTTVSPAILPGWITLGKVIVGVGAIIIFVGFIFGGLAASNIGTSATNQGNAQNYVNDFEAFFVLTGVGILIAMAGWGFHSIWPKFKARPRLAFTYVPPVAAAPAPAGMAAPPPPPPAGLNCPKCGNPTTYIAQYGRYYCFTDNQYL